MARLKKEKKETFPLDACSCGPTCSSRLLKGHLQAEQNILSDTSLTRLGSRLLSLSSSVDLSSNPLREEIKWCISNWLDFNDKTTEKSHQPGWSGNLLSLNRARFTSLTTEKTSFVHMSKTITRRGASEVAIVVLLF